MSAPKNHVSKVDDQEEEEKIDTTSRVQGGAGGESDSEREEV